MRIEVRIDVAVPDPAERGPAALGRISYYARESHIRNAHRADTKQGHVVHDVLATKQRELTADEDLRPVLEADRHIDLAHIDLGAELVVRAGVLNLRREPEMDPQVQAAFLPPRLESCERREQSGTDARVRGPAVVNLSEHPEGVHVPGKLERPAVRHLHRQALRLGRRSDAKRETQQQQRETLHTRTPPWGVGLLGSLLVWLLTYACRVTDLIGKSESRTSS